MSEEGSGMGALSPDNVQQVIEGIKTISDAIKTVAEERTKQVQLRTDAALEVKRIEAYRDLVMDYLDRSFDERKTNFEKLFETLDDAIANDRVEVVSSTLGAVVQLAQSSPFKALENLDSTKKLLAQKGTEWEL